MPDVIEDWKIEVMKLLGLKEEKIENSPNQGTGAMIKARIRDPKTVLGDVQMPGNGPPTGRLGKALAKQLFGARDGRQSIDGANTQKILESQNRGESTPVRLNANGRTLSGNFFTAKGHNLKDQDFKPDLSRPVVLLLTGSGGSAEDQGLDMAQMYAGGGASVLSVNYGGYGGSSDDEVSEKSLNEDAQAMLEHLVAMGYDPENIVIHGYSMGAAVAGQLGGEYEKRGIRFRGMVQDRPMATAYDGVVGHFNNPIGMLGGIITEKTVGSLDGKSGLLESDKSTRKVVTTDKGAFAGRGDSLRDKLEKEGHEVSGERTGKGHFDHQAVIEQNRDALLDLVRYDREGQEHAQPLDLDVVFRETVNPLIETVRGFQRRIGEAKRGADVGELGAIFKDINQSEEAIRQIDASGAGKCKRFESEMTSLESHRRAFDRFRDDILKSIRELSGGNSLAAEELVRLAPPAAVLVNDLDLAGGPKPENKALEERVLQSCAKFTLLLSEVTDEETLRREHSEVYATFEDLDEARKEILKSRADRDKKVDYASDELALTPQRRDLAEDARAELRREMKGDFDKLNPEKEDVSAERLIGRSADKGFKKLVVDPVNAITKVLKENMTAERPVKITPESMPEVEQVRQGLAAALLVYSKKLAETNQKKHPKDYEQRKKKVDAIQSRLDGLLGLIDKCNRHAELIEEKYRSHEVQSLEELRDSGDVEKAVLVVGSLRDDLLRDTGDSESDQKSRDRANKNAKSLATFLNRLDPLQREAMGRLKLEPNGLAKTLANMGLGVTYVVDGVVEQCTKDGDDEYLYTLLDACVAEEFETLKSGTKALRNTNGASRLATLIASRGEAREYCEEFAEEVISAVKGKSLEVKPPVPPPQNAAPKVKLAYDQEVKRCKENVEAHAEIFRKIVRGVLSKPVPKDIVKVASTIYAESMRKSGDEEESLAYVGGLVILRLLGPSFVTFDFGGDLDGKRSAVIQNKLLQNLANNVHFKEEFMQPFNSVIDELSGEMQEFFKAIAAEGALLRDGVDTGDLASEALQSRKVVDSLFLAPSRQDPLGTLPSNRSTPLGRAILRVRGQRNMDYDWDKMAERLREDPTFYDDGIYGERCEVLELVRDE